MCRTSGAFLCNCIYKCVGDEFCAFVGVSRGVYHAFDQ